jgi:hypothetical protein
MVTNDETEFDDTKTYGRNRKDNIFVINECEKELKVKDKQSDVS